MSGADPEAKALAAVITAERFFSSIDDPGVTLAWLIAAADELRRQVGARRAYESIQRQADRIAEPFLEAAK